MNMRKGNIFKAICIIIIQVFIFEQIALGIKLPSANNSGSFVARRERGAILADGVEIQSDAVVIGGLRIGYSDTESITETGFDPSKITSIQVDGSEDLPYSIDAQVQGDIGRVVVVNGSENTVMQRDGNTVSVITRDEGYYNAIFNIYEVYPESLEETGKPDHSYTIKVTKEGEVFIVSQEPDRTVIFQGMDESGALFERFNGATNIYLAEINELLIQLQDSSMITIVDNGISVINKNQESISKEIYALSEEGYTLDYSFKLVEENGNKWAVETDAGNVTAYQLSDESVFQQAIADGVLSMDEMLAKSYMESTGTINIERNGDVTTLSVNLEDMVLSMDCKSEQVATGLDVLDNLEENLENIDRFFMVSRNDEGEAIVVSLILNPTTGEKELYIDTVEGSDATTDLNVLDENSDGEAGWDISIPDVSVFSLAGALSNIEGAEAFSAEPNTSGIKWFNSAIKATALFETGLFLAAYNFLPIVGAISPFVLLPMGAVMYSLLKGVAKFSTKGVLAANLSQESLVMPEMEPDDIRTMVLVPPIAIDQKDVDKGMFNLRKTIEGNNDRDNRVFGYATDTFNHELIKEEIRGILALQREYGADSVYYFVRNGATKILWKAGDYQDLMQLLYQGWQTPHTYTSSEYGVYQRTTEEPMFKVPEEVLTDLVAEGTLTQEEADEIGRTGVVGDVSALHIGEEEERINTFYVLDFEDYAAEGTVTQMERKMAWAVENTDYGILSPMLVPSNPNESWITRFQYRSDVQLHWEQLVNWYLYKRTKFSGDGALYIPRYMDAMLNINSQELNEAEPEVERLITTVLSEDMVALSSNNAEIASLYEQLKKETDSFGQLFYDAVIQLQLKSESETESEDNSVDRLPLISSMNEMVLLVDEMINLADSNDLLSTVRDELKLIQEILKEKLGPKIASHDYPESLYIPGALMTDVVVYEERMQTFDGLLAQFGRWFKSDIRTIKEVFLPTIPAYRALMSALGKPVSPPRGIDTTDPGVQEIMDGVWRSSIADWLFAGYLAANTAAAFIPSAMSLVNPALGLALAGTVILGQLIAVPMIFGPVMKAMNLDSGDKNLAIEIAQKTGGAIVNWLSSASFIMKYMYYRPIIDIKNIRAIMAEGDGKAGIGGATMGNIAKNLPFVIGLAWEFALWQIGGLPTALFGLPIAVSFLDNPLMNVLLNRSDTFLSESIQTTEIQEKNDWINFQIGSVFRSEHGDENQIVRVKSIIENIEKNDLDKTGLWSILTESEKQRILALGIDDVMISEAQAQQHLYDYFNSIIEILASKQAS